MNEDEFVHMLATARTEKPDNPHLFDFYRVGEVTDADFTIMVWSGFDWVDFKNLNARSMG